MVRSRPIAALGAAAGLGLSVLVPAASPADAAPAIRIVEIHYDSPGKDTPVTNRKLNGEYIVIKNFGKTTRTLTGWRIRDKAGHVYVFPGTKLGAGKSLTLRTGKGTNEPRLRFWNMGWYVWNNSGSEKATLKNRAGDVVDTCSYTGSSAGEKSC
jgi:Lamin Tail Domain